MTEQFDKLGIANTLHDLIIDENEAIQGYNDAYAMCVELGQNDLAKIMKDIAGEEYAHIGELQKALEMVSDEAREIKDGEEETMENVGMTESVGNCNTKELMKRKNQLLRRLDRAKDEDTMAYIEAELRDLDMEIAVCNESVDTDDEIREKIYELEKKIQRLVKRYRAVQKQYHGDSASSKRIEAEIDSLSLEQKKLKAKLQPMKEEYDDEESVTEYIVYDNDDAVERFSDMNRAIRYCKNNNCQWVEEVEGHYENDPEDGRIFVVDEGNGSVYGTDGSFKESLHIKADDMKVWRTIRDGVKNSRGAKKLDKNEVENVSDNVLDNLYTIDDNTYRKRATKKNESFTVKDLSMSKKFATLNEAIDYYNRYTENESVHPYAHIERTTNGNSTLVNPKNGRPQRFSTKLNESFTNKNC